MEYMKNYNEWLNSPFIDDDIKEELKAISGDEKEIQERFYRNLEFGTGGMRGIIGAGTNRMNKHIIGKATQGLADFIRKNSDGKKSCVIAHDSRRKSKEFSNIAACVLAANGVKAYLFEDLRSTPQLSFAVRELKCTAGIVITASHNPPEYNGYKVYWDYGCQMLPEMAEALIVEIENISFDQINIENYDKAVSEGLIEILGKEFDDKFLNTVKTVSLREDIDKNIKIVYTPLHGTGGYPVTRVLKEKGFNKLYLVEEQMNPDGEFPTVNYPNPEDEKAFEYAYKKAVDVDADIVVANDPDCDRVGVSVRERVGKYRLLSGNQIGALLIEYILSSLKEKNIMPENPLIIKTIVTSDFGKCVAEYYGVECIETLTGFKFIGEKIEEYSKNKEKNYVFGYEESIGYLIGDFVRDKDAVTSTMIVCEMAAYYKKNGSNLLDELEKLYKKHGYFIDGLKSITLEGIEGNEKILKIMDYFRNSQISEIAGYRIKVFSDFEKDVTYNFANGNKSTTGLPRSNVLKYVFENDSWFVLRPSGTEPKIKVYFSSVDEKKEKAKEIYNKINEEVLKIIKEI